jgi:AcrR family transcriptional regulator
MEREEATMRLLDAAESLFYDRGIQAVGMDEIRAASRVSLKRLYQCFPSKDGLVQAYLRRRDGRWRAALADHVARHAHRPAERPLAVFDWLAGWFAEPGFRGCAFVNSFGELGTASPGVADAAREHKLAVRDYLAALVRDLPVDDPDGLAEQLLLLMDGAITTAAVTGDPAAARHARTAAATLLAASGGGPRPR